MTNVAQAAWKPSQENPLPLQSREWLPPNATPLKLPDGRVLPGAFIIPNFIEEELGLNHSTILSALNDYPTRPNDQEIPFIKNGGECHWIEGGHPSLKMRGNEIARKKMWFQTGKYEDGLIKYFYTIK